LKAAWLSDPKYFDATPIAHTSIPQELRRWVALEGSMTQELGEHFGQLPEVQVHYSNNSALCDWEAELLVEQGSTEGSSATGFARHISLNVGNKPLLFARSVVLQGSTITPLLSELQRTPLARVLFEEDQWQRVNEPIPLQADGPRYGRACIWQEQRSLDRLLVEEFFLF
jgi:chorismate-pyruvate lyase